MIWFQNVPFPVRHRLYVQSDEETREGEVGGRAEEEGRVKRVQKKGEGGIHLHTMLRVGCWVIQGLREEDKKRRGKHQTGWLECREGLQMTLEI